MTNLNQQQKDRLVARLRKVAAEHERAKQSDIAKVFTEIADGIAGERDAEPSRQS